MQKSYIKNNNTERSVIILRYLDELFDFLWHSCSVFISNISDVKILSVFRLLLKNNCKMFPR